ncbi:MAG: hypothetical protein JWL59_2301 [Chthoniobacteraceae bacterium]|nr:hypothetical protein [Chthoniobacteraceae bacterium]
MITKIDCFSTIAASASISFTRVPHSALSAAERVSSFGDFQTSYLSFYQPITEFLQPAMRLILFPLFIAFLTSQSNAQIASVRDNTPTKGSLYVAVDDAAKIYINGTEVYKAGTGETRSPEIGLKTGDRVVVQLQNNGGPRRFMLVFASSDGQNVVSFKNHDFKIIPDIDVTDFTSEQFQKWTKFAKQDKHKENATHMLPIKSYSEWIWGDFDKCILAAIVTPQMLAQKPK